MSRIVTALLCGALALALAPALGQADGDAMLEQLVVEMAETPKEHAALARYYEAKAEEARDEAARHERMGHSYHGAKFPNRTRMRAHCAKISEKYNAMADEYDALAKLHEEEAK